MRLLVGILLSCILVFDEPLNRRERRCLAKTGFIDR